MHFLALILALGAERFVTQVLHWRELRMMDKVFDKFTALLSGYVRWQLWTALIVFLIICVLPVALIAWLLSDILWGGLYLIFAATVLFFSLGPRDVFTVADGFVDAVDDNDLERAAHCAHALLEDQSDWEQASPKDLAQSVMVQAENSIFGVIFWFVVLGPVGAWAFRVVNLYRRRLAFQAKRHSETHHCYHLMEQLNQINGVLAWPSSRCLSIGFALAGSFEGALAKWRGVYTETETETETEAPFYSMNETIVIAAGQGALGDDIFFKDATELETKREAVRRSRNLVWRTLIIWLAVIALLVLWGGLR